VSTKPKAKTPNKKSSKVENVDHFAGGAHQTNVPDAGRLPLPSSLTTTPQKSRSSRSNVASPQPVQVVQQPTPTPAVQMEQSLKAMLKIGP
jgi:hypothetical protein